MANWFSKLTRSRQQNPPLTDLNEAIDSLPFRLEKVSDLISADRMHVLQQFRQVVESQLEIIRLALNANSVVLLWSGPANGNISTYAFSSVGSDVVTGSYPVGAGIFGALKDCSEITLSPYGSNSPSIPYYRNTINVGAFIAQNVYCGDQNIQTSGDSGILCADRNSVEAWSAAERQILDKAAQHIAKCLAISRDLLLTDVERRALQLVFNGLRTLNSALDMQSVYEAACKSLGFVVQSDLVAISLIDGENHEIHYLEGHCTSTVLHQRFKLADSIVGQAVKYRCILPERASSIGRAPVVNGLKLFDLYQSVLVVPLYQEDTPVSGVLIVAARAENQFARNCPEMLEMIAAQVAIKVDLAHSHEQIQQMAITDPLTGIANRRAFKRGFAAMHERAKRRNGKFSLIICDIDLFKRINDVYGHPFGDQVIQQVANQLADVVRVGDLSARIGGEEFAILLEDTGLAGAMDVAERLRKNVENLKLSFQGETVPVTISLGVAAFPADTDNQEKLLNYADQALYRAKKNGRNRSENWGSCV